MSVMSGLWTKPSFLDAIGIKKQADGAAAATIDARPPPSAGNKGLDGKVAAAPHAGNSANTQKEREAKITSRLAGLKDKYKSVVSDAGPDVAVLQDQMKVVLTSIKNREANATGDLDALELLLDQPEFARGKSPQAGSPPASQTGTLSAGPAGPGAGSSAAGQGGSANSEPDAALDATSPDFFFDKNSAKLTDSAKESLDAYAKVYLREKTSEPIAVDGYASIDGDPNFNKQLSQERADSVANYLKKKGVPKVAAKGHGPTGSKDELRQNRRATVKPPLTVRDIVGEVVVEPPIPGKQSNPTLGEKADQAEISNVPIPEPPPKDDGPAPKYPDLDDGPKPAEPVETPKTKPPKEDDGPVKAAVVDEVPLHGGSPSDPKISVGIELQYTLEIRDTEGAWVMKSIDLTVSVGKEGKPGPVAEAQLNVIQGKLGHLMLAGKTYKAQITLSLNGEVVLSGDHLESIKGSVQASLELELSKRTSLRFDVKPIAKTVYQDPSTATPPSNPPEVAVVVSTTFGGGDDKKEKREQSKKTEKEVKEDHSPASKEGDKERKQITKMYEAARDNALSKLQDRDVKEKAKKEMDEAIKDVRHHYPFVASEALTADVSSKVMIDMTKAVDDYLKRMFLHLGGENY